MVLCALALAMTGCSKKEEPAAEEPAAEVEAATAAEALQKGVENAATDVKEGGSTAVEALTSGDTEGAVDAAKDGVSEAVEDLKEGVSGFSVAPSSRRHQMRRYTGPVPIAGWAFLCGGTPPGNCGNFRINRLYFVFSANITCVLRIYVMKDNPCGYTSPCPERKHQNGHLEG